jgi:hypothetical protein
VPIGTDAFVRSFVAKTCRDIIDDVEKLDAIQDGCIHFQLLRFCQATRFQYINSHIILSNRCVLQQQHVDCKIADTLSGTLCDLAWCFPSGTSGGVVA